MDLGSTGICFGLDSCVAMFKLLFMQRVIRSHSMEIYDIYLLSHTNPLWTVIVKQLASIRDRKTIYDFGVCSCDLLGSNGGGFGRLSATSGIQNPELQTANYSMRHLDSKSMEF